MDSPDRHSAGSVSGRDAQAGNRRKITVVFAAGIYILQVFLLLMAADILAIEDLSREIVVVLALLFCAFPPLAASRIASALFDRDEAGKAAAPDLAYDAAGKKQASAAAHAAGGGNSERDYYQQERFLRDPAWLGAYERFCREHPPVPVAPLRADNGSAGLSMRNFLLRRYAAGIFRPMNFLAPALATAMTAIWLFFSGADLETAAPAAGILALLEIAYFFAVFMIKTAPARLWLTRLPEGAAYGQLESSFLRGRILEHGRSAVVFGVSHVFLLRPSSMIHFSMTSLAGFRRQVDHVQNCRRRFFGYEPGLVHYLELVPEDSHERVWNGSRERAWNGSRERAWNGSHVRVEISGSESVWNAGGASGRRELAMLDEFQVQMALEELTERNPRHLSPAPCMYHELVVKRPM
ncbi:MAG: hypothetical protein IJ523_05785 [Succinivibrionaceae bacterium]|nr:hypothetical protein [Succinivibrionaceae bacterium]